MAEARPEDHSAKPARNDAKPSEIGTVPARARMSPIGRMGSGPAHLRSGRAVVPRRRDAALPRAARHRGCCRETAGPFGRPFRSRVRCGAV